MKQASEFVSLGHPDKIADYISSYLLDRYLDSDPLTRFAVECQIKGPFVTLGGEITSRLRLSDEDITTHVRDAVREIGYDREYRESWGVEHTICGDGLVVTSHITRQSPDISKGVDEDGWGDQGIYWGMATPDSDTGYMPRDYHIARAICNNLYLLAVHGCSPWGLDIKTLVELDDGKISRLIVAAPCASDRAQVRLIRDVNDQLDHYGRRGHDTQLIVNGTGRFVTHGPIADCGTTGRKLAVDFYGGNCRIGGGSPWTKDGTKADVALNLYARKIALAQMRDLGGTVYVSIASSIGRRSISVTVYGDNMHQLRTWVEDRPASEIIDELDLRDPSYAKRCMAGLFWDIE